MAQLEATVSVAVSLTRSQAAVLARAVVVVTSALDCWDANAAEQGLLLFRQAVARAVSNDSPRQPRPASRPCRQASRVPEGFRT